MSATPSSSPQVFDPSVVDAVRRLRSDYPDAPFLTLGQTVLWDEPVKAAFCRILEAVAPDATMVAAVHDTDYFAKLGSAATAAGHAPELAEHHGEGDHRGEADHRGETVVTAADAANAIETTASALGRQLDKFVMLPHNDGSTRGLWSAAGELSSLFGSETVPTRHALTQYGVAFDRVARTYPGGARALLEEQTEAWGWRALVHAEAHPLIAADVKLTDIAPALRRQLQWGFGQSLQIPRFGNDEASRARAAAGEAVAAHIQNSIDEYIEINEEGTLSDLYRALTPRLWSLVRGGGSCNLQTATSTELFRFNRRTAGLPRFRFVDLFLQPASCEMARRCYDDAVRGSGIYQLAQFGEGALPFDVVIRGRGRGTLRRHGDSLTIETEEPITLCNGCSCTSVAELAGLLEDTFGEDVALVGKAVALISMLAAEFIFVFHEKASSYTARTYLLNQCLREQGFELPLHPMLRLEYATWSALRGVATRLRLPRHLADAFGCEEISADQFSNGWQEACERCDQLLERLQKCTSPRDLLQFLATRQAPGQSADGARWTQRLGAYEEARAVIARVRCEAATLGEEVAAARAEAQQAQLRANACERAKGENWRAQVQPLRVQLSDLREAQAQRLVAAGMPGNAAPGKAALGKQERAAARAAEAAAETTLADLRAAIAAQVEARAHFDSDIEARRGEVREAKARARALTLQRVARERSDAATAARAAIAQIEYEAELARLLATRDALLAGRGLRYTNARPTAWWFPLVSPEGTWFNNLVSSARARIEAL